MRKFLLALCTALVSLAGLNANAATKPTSLDDMVGWKVGIVFRGSEAQNNAPMGTFLSEIIKEGNTFYLKNFMGDSNVKLAVQGTNLVFIYQYTNTGGFSIPGTGLDFRPAKKTVDGNTVTYEKNARISFPNLFDFNTNYLSSNGVFSKYTDQSLIITYGGKSYGCDGFDVYIFPPMISATSTDGEECNIYKYDGTNKQLWGYDNLPFAYNENVYGNRAFGLKVSGSNPFTSIPVETVWKTCSVTEVSATSTKVVYTKQENPETAEYKLSAKAELGTPAVPELLYKRLSKSGGNWVYSNYKLKAGGVQYTIPELAVYNATSNEVVKEIPSYIFSDNLSTSKDVTPTGTLKVNGFYKDANGIYALVEFTPGNFNNLVDSYTLYVVPTTDKPNSTTLASSWTPSSPTAGAIALTEAYDYVAPQGEHEVLNEDGKVVFSKQVSASEIDVDSPYYTFFVGYNLKPDLGGTYPSTIYSTVYSYNGVITGVENVGEEVVGDEVLYVYNTQGVLVMKTTDRTLPGLEKGIYIVNGKKILK